MKRSIGCMIAICILLSSITVNAQIRPFWADGDFNIICDLGIVPKEYREKDINDLVTRAEVVHTLSCLVFADNYLAFRRIIKMEYMRILVGDSRILKVTLKIVL